MLLLDEPAAGVPRDESAELFAVIANLSRDITVLFIEHDMNFVFRFASRIIVMVGGRILVEGTPDEIAADPRVREVYLGKSRMVRVMAEPLLALDDVRAGYGDAVVLDGISLEVPEHGSLAVLGRNGVGKSTLLLTIMGYTNVSARHDRAGAAQDITALAAAPARARRPRLGRAGARDLSLAQRRGEPHRRGAARPLGPRRRSTSCSRASPSGAPTWATSSPAASSRCSRSRAR